MKKLLLIPLCIVAMDSNKDVALKLTHTLSYNKHQLLTRQEWDVEAQVFDFQWPISKRFECWRSPSVKAALVAGCATVSAASLATLALIITQSS